jgi:small neutral amino acid transporter SnatA (MarC family)
VWTWLHDRKFHHRLHYLFCRHRPDRQRTKNIDDRTADAINSDSLAIYSLAIPLLASSSAIMSVIVVKTGFAGSIASIMTVYAPLIAELVATGFILCLTVAAEGLLNEKSTIVFSRITAIILACLTV